MIEAATQQESSSVQTRALQVASSFTARPLAKTLRSYLIAAGIADAVEFVEYGHVAEYMLGPASAAENILGTVVLVRLEDSLRDQFKNGVGAGGGKLPPQPTLNVCGNCVSRRTHSSRLANYLDRKSKEGWQTGLLLQAHLRGTGKPISQNFSPDSRLRSALPRLGPKAAITLTEFCELPRHFL